MKFSTRIGNWRIGLILKPFFFRTLFVNGFTSDVFSGKGEHIVLWDFDVGISDWRVFKALQFIKKRKELGRIYVFQSGKRESYRAICLDKLPLKEMVRAVSETPLVDIAFLKWTMIRRSSTIRYSPKYNEKIRYIGRLGGESTREKSLSHAKILNALYGIPIPENCDKGFGIRLVHYETIDRTIDQATT
jgi:hypothetical protein